MLALDAHTCDFVARSVISIRYYFRPSNGLSEPTGSISVALKSREQGTSSPPCARSAEYFLRPVTVHSIVATSTSPKQRTRPRYLSRQIFYDTFFTATAYRFRALFRTLTTLQPPPPILIYIHGSVEYISFRKSLPWQLLSRMFLPLLSYTISYKRYVVKFSC